MGRYRGVPRRGGSVGESLGGRRRVIYFCMLFKPQMLIYSIVDGGVRPCVAVACCPGGPTYRSGVSHGGYLLSVGATNMRRRAVNGCLIPVLGVAA